MFCRKNLAERGEVSGGSFMNWKIFGVLLVGVGLLAACGASQEEPTMASPAGDRETQKDAPGGASTEEAKPPPPPVTPTKDLKKDAVLHD